jgi:hypothetical protein
VSVTVVEVRAGRHPPAVTRTARPLDGIACVDTACTERGVAPALRTVGTEFDQRLDLAGGGSRFEFTD